VSIYGRGFVAGARVSFIDPAGTTYVCCSAGAPNIVSATLIGAQPNFAGDAGTWRVIVRNPDGRQASLSFTVVP
jgi:hypothetical protein